MRRDQTESEQRLHERLSELENTYRAILNILEDVNTERDKSDDTRRALTNILDDVETERAKAEKAKTLLEATNKELEAFSYSVSHDLRAPLRAISGFSEAVIEDYSAVVGDEGRRYLKLIAENANKMGQLIDDLLSFSRLGRQQIIKTEIDMSALAKTVSEESDLQVRGRDIKFNIDPVPYVFGDKAMIQQALVNLFSNAVKFTKNTDAASIYFGCLNDNGENVYYVKDNGVGFDMRYVDKLFGVFQRLHSDAEFEGTGVGLALVYRIITRHGGRVWAKSELQKGATFYFTLPNP
jgi:light-regulated signal transduction histidine kinase (bacteriophytochrome)